MTDIEDLTKLANLRPKKEYEIKDVIYFILCIIVGIIIALNMKD